MPPYTAARCHTQSYQVVIGNLLCPLHLGLRIPVDQILEGKSHAAHGIFILADITTFAQRHGIPVRRSGVLNDMCFGLCTAADRTSINMASGGTCAFIAIGTLLCHIFLADRAYAAVPAARQRPVNKTGMCALCHGKGFADALITVRISNRIFPRIFYSFRFQVTRPPICIRAKLHSADGNCPFQRNLVCIVLSGINQSFRNRNHILVYISQKISISGQNACPGQGILVVNAHRTVVFQCDTIGNRQRSAFRDYERTVRCYGQTSCKSVGAIDLIYRSRTGFEKFIGNSLHRAAVICSDRFFRTNQELAAACNL